MADPLQLVMKTVNTSLSRFVIWFPPDHSYGAGIRRSTKHHEISPNFFVFFSVISWIVSFRSSSLETRTTLHGSGKSILVGIVS